MLTPDEIIILHSTPFSEKSVIIHTLSRTYGRRSFLVRNAGGCMSFFQPLSILECGIYENPKSNLFSAKDFYASVPLGGIRGSIGKNAISMFMAEVLFRSVREGMDEPGLYDWCVEEILLLDALIEDYSNFHIRFLLDFAAAMGFRPDFDSLFPFLESPETPDTVSVNLAGTVRHILDLDFSETMLIPMKGRMRGEICDRLLKYLEFHLENRLNIRSLSVLSELF